MRIKMLHCVPTYNNPGTIAAVVLSLLHESSHDVLVVDDGSDTPAKEIVGDQNRLFYLRFNSNQGKGLALQAAFKWALENGYTHVVTSDGDGQHPAKEVLKVLRSSIENPWSLIVGNRNMNTEHVPGISKFGRKFSNFWVQYQTDIQVADSQSGLRAYPIIHIQNMKFFTKRFDFEIEVLIRLIWKGIDILEEPVEVIYHSEDVRVSHFDKFWDNLRITLLNTLLIILSLLKEQSSPFKLAAAFGVGIFIGCTPFYGFHMLLSAALSFFFKLNFVALVAGNQISLPPLLPILVPTAVAIGHKALNHGGPLSFFVGTSLLGAGLGILGFFVLWIFLHRQQKAQKAAVWRGEQRGGKLGNSFLKGLMKVMGLKAAYLCVMIFVIPYFYLFSKKARKAASQFWLTVDPTLNFFNLQMKIIKQMYRFAATLLDSVYISMKGNTAFQFRSIGYEDLKTAIDSKKGIMMFTAHCGAWSLSARAIARHSFSQPLQTVRFEGDGLTLSKIQNRENAPKEILVNSQTLPVLEIRKSLQAGNVVSVMADRPQGNRLELVKFFGKWIIADLSPFRTALACNSFMFYGFGFNEGYRKYFFQVAEIKNPENTSFSSKDDEAYALAQQFFKNLEIFVRQNPEQWFNWYEYFSYEKKLFQNTISQPSPTQATLR